MRSLVLFLFLSCCWPFAHAQTGTRPSYFIEIQDQNLSNLNETEHLAQSSDHKIYVQTTTFNPVKRFHYVLDSLGNALHRVQWIIPSINYYYETDVYFTIGNGCAISSQKVRINPSNTRATLVIRHDSLGHIVSVYTFDEGMRAFPSATGGYFVGGRDNNNVMRIAQYTANDELAWEKSYTDNSDLPIASAIQNPSTGDIAMLFESDHAPSDLFIDRLDGNGNLLQATAYPFGNINLFNTAGLMLRDNGELIAAFSENAIAAWLISFAADGQVRWSKTYWYPSSTSTFMRSNAIMEGTDGNIRLFISMRDVAPANDNFSGTVTIAPNNGQVISFVRSTDFFELYGQYPQTEPGKNFYVFDPRVQHGIKLRMVNDLGNVVCGEQGGTLPLALDTITAPATNVSVTAYADSLQRTPQMNFNESSVPESYAVTRYCDFVPMPVPSAVEVYTSTASGNLTILFTGTTATDGYTWEIYDLSGREMSTGPITGNMTEININALADGMYIVSVAKGQRLNPSVTKIVTSH